MSFPEKKRMEVVVLEASRSSSTIAEIHSLLWIARLLGF